MTLKSPDTSIGNNTSVTSPSIDNSRLSIPVMFTVNLPSVTSWPNSSVTFTLIVTFPAVLFKTDTVVVVSTLLSINVLFAVVWLTNLFPPNSTVMLYVPFTLPM